MSPRSYSAILFGVLLSGACTYSLDEEVFIVDVQKPVVADGTIDLSKYEGVDTIRMYSDQDFSFSIEADKYISAEVTIDGARILSTTNAVALFRLTEALMGGGIHQLKISFIAMVNSGSLAGSAGYEAATSSKTWVIVADFTPPETPVITSSIENGMLKLSWVGTKKPNFSSYNLMMYNNFRKRQQITITDARQTSYYDSVYNGDYNVSYGVMTVAGQKTSSSSLDVKGSQGAIIIYSATDSSATFTWHKSKYTAAFGSFNVYENDDPRLETTNPRDTTYKFKLNAVFGIGENVRFKVLDKFGNLTYQASLNVDNPTGAKRTHYTKFFYSSTLSSMMGYNQSGYLATLDSRLKGIDSVRIPTSTFSFPYPGRYVFYAIQNGVAMFDLVTKQQVTFGTTGKTGNPKTPTLVAGSNNQVVFYSFVDSTIPLEPWAISGAIDMSTQTSLQRSTVALFPEDVPNYHPSNRYSDDGRYFYNSIYRYSISNGLTTAIGSVPNRAFEFRPENNDEIICGTAVGDVQIADALTGTLLRTLSPPSLLGGTVFSNSYDTMTKKLFYYTNASDIVYLVDIDTGQSTTVIAFGAGCTFFGGYLIDSRGLYQKVL